MPHGSQIIVALDRSSREEILSLADRLSGAVGMMKLGLQAFTANGPSIVGELQDRGIEVFLDLKFHDIPNTVLHAVQESVRLGVKLLTIHTLGGVQMMRAAVEGARDSETRLLGVTILTSHDQASLGEIGLDGSIGDTVGRLAEMAQRSGVDGVVASPLEIASLRERHGDGFLIVTPGIRSSADAAGDQRRTMSAREALAAGASHLVVGRPITAAPDPREAVARLFD